MRTLFTTALLIGAMAAYASAQGDQIVGGYGDANVKDKDVRHAAAVAIRQHSRRAHHAVTLVKINKAEQQVVSGMNYRLCMSVRRGRRGRVHTVTAVVYQPIRKPMRLTNWQEGGCKEL
ncbi:MAG: hypothetical protein JO314_11970 [Acidobacteria bacterium]|nr:hypothetical protein [Acidobacteriota bacterium]